MKTWSATPPLPRWMRGCLAALVVAAVMATLAVLILATPGGVR